MSEIKWIDHGVLPTNDLGHAILFYRDVLGAEIESLEHVSTRTLTKLAEHGPSSVERSGQGRPDDRATMRCFMRLGPTRFGLFLQQEELPPAGRDCRTPCYEWEVREEDLGRVVSKLEEYGIDYEGPVESPPGYPMAKQVFFRDLDGNPAALCVVR